MRKVKFILVGCGNIGERHARLASQKGELLAVCDIDEKKVRHFSRQFQCYGYTSFERMIAEEGNADVLLVCTPNGLHSSHSIAGLKAGKHVLCEKPMALSVADCRKMIAAATKANKHLLVVKQNRFNPPVAALKKLIDKNKLGEIYTVQLNCYWNRGQNYYKESSWRGTKKLDGGVLFTQFSHFIDLLYWCFGSLQKADGKIFNLAHQKQIEIEDTGVFTFLIKDSTPGILSYSTNATNKNYEGSLTVIAEKATIKIGGPYLNKIEYQEPELIDLSALNEGKEVNQYNGYQGSMNNHGKVYDELLQVISGKKKKYTSGEEAMHSVQIIEKLYNASSKKK